MKLLKIILFVLILLVLMFLFINLNKKSDVKSTPSKNSEKTAKLKAKFAIYTSGTFRIFSDQKYHNLSEKVYIQSENPNTVVVEYKKIRWKDFFDTLPMKLTKKCLTTGTNQVFCDGDSGRLTFYLNGALTPDLLDEEIKNKNQALILFGNYTENQITQYRNQFKIIN